MWDTLRDDPSAARRGLDGTVAGGDHAVAYAGAAGAAWAAGDHDAARDLLDRAQKLDAEHPTYYGSAWTELTRAMLVDGSLGDC
jgi:hypothetical protein